MPRWWLSLGLVSLVALLALAWPAAAAQGTNEGAALHAEIDRRAGALHARLVAWRRDFHQHPELSNREVRTAGVVAEHLRALGLEVETGVARTGVVAVLRGGLPGPTVALRADMDALPVVEQVELPFKSTVRTTYNGLDVGVMHACGHDLHTAMLMGAAEVLAGLRARIPGTVKFIFQPAEEGPPAGEDGGAPLMIKEGVLEKDNVAAIFGLHVFPFEVGTIAFRPQGLMAASDSYRIRVRGSQTHGALPWRGVDPIVVSAQIVLGLQTIVSRQSDLTRAPAVVTVGTFRGGTRTNIVPEEAVLEGTIRTFDPAMQDDIHARVTRTAQQIAASAGATAEVQIERGNPVTWNDPALTERMTPTLRRVATGPFLPNVQVTTTAEDFASYQKVVPGLFVFLGITPRGADPSTIHPNHSPRFYADEGALVPGVRALASLAVDYLAGSASGRGPGGGPAQAPAEGVAIDVAPADLRPAVQRAEAAMTALQASLLRRLQEATKDGPGAALDVCRVEAGAIRDRVVTEQGLAVGRTSHALRNPLNTPPAWAAALVAKAAGRPAKAFSPRVFDLGDKVGVIRPIPMGLLCSNCHGSAESLSAAVRASLQRAYPTDAATGFAEGDLRGWIWAEAPRHATR